MTEPQEAADAARGTCSGWEARYDWMPPSPTLLVWGSCEFPTAGYSVELRPARPQGINPEVYLLERVVHAPEGPVAQVLTTVQVHYREDTEARYTQVHIVPDDVLIPVEHVS